MPHLNIVRAWKDEGYRLSLSAEERARLPANPAGAMELTDADLEAAAGGITSPATPCWSDYACPTDDCTWDCPTQVWTCQWDCTCDPWWCH